MSYKICTEVSDLCPVSATTYGYYPNFGGNVFFTAFFGALFISGLAIGIRGKTWTFALALGIGSGLEMLGYVGRVMMHKNPWDSAGFKMQICCIVLGPSFLAACVYLTMKHLVLHFGPEHSLLKARLYPWIFVGCDLGSIVLQAIGGGVAASAGDTGNMKLLDAGNGLIVAGIAFQVATMTGCGLLVALYIFRYKKAAKLGTPTTEKNEYNAGENRKLRLFCIAIAIAYITILTRCVYRLPEMSGGWGNPLMQNELEFLILDGAMIAIATLVMTIFHPAFYLPGMSSRKSAAVTESPSTSDISQQHDMPQKSDERQLTLAIQAIQKDPTQSLRAISKVYSVDHRKVARRLHEVIRGWFELLRNTIAKYGIYEADIYNFDETGFMMGVISTAMVVTSSDGRAKAKRVQPGNREWVTVIQG
ncbi:hypothetical protein V493_00289, partial [Pseudogymnoascus sp. VKM F-4281 (FW-2241)]